MATSSDLQTPAAKRRTPDRERSRTLILDAAYRLFADRGFMATTVTEIAREAGVAKGLVTFHFTSKEEVFREVLARIIPMLLHGVDDIDPKDPRSAAELLGAVIREIYGNIVKRPEGRDLLRLLVAEGHRAPSLTAAYHREVVQRGNAALMRIIEIGIQRGEFVGPLDPDDSHVLVGPIILAIFWDLLFGDIERIDIDKLCDRHVTLALNGLLRRG